MLINLRNALMAGKRLPYDAEVEYLESTGTQWIDTGIAAFAWPYLEITCKVNGTYTTDYSKGIIGNSNGGSRWQGIAPDGTTRVTFRGYNNSTTISESVTADFITLVFDGPNRTAYAGQSSATLLSGNAAGAAYGVWAYVGRNEYPIAMSVASVKIGTSRDNLLFDAIPVRKGTVGYLYDRVSGKLFGNEGTGDFVIGPDVVPVEYIESHGTEWIDTDKSVDLPIHLEADINFTNPNTGSNVQTLVGGYKDSEANQRFWVTSLPQGKINCALLTNSISTNLVPANKKVHLAVDFENGRQTATIDGVQYTSASQSTTNYWFRNWKLRIFQSFGTVIGSNNIPLQAITNRINIDIGASQALRLSPVRVGTEGALIDTLTRRIYRNAGTGAFGYGNDLKYPIPAE